ncbi:LytTR family DNA-binding domain-containing protein [Phenylobacterium sp.]|uniref:LytTR family DNA-binding domain-containing protein n=1 Tax=Phenylobacterium sp. TaxID=1871053 RepID=UPI0035ADE11F
MLERIRNLAKGDRSVFWRGLALFGAASVFYDTIAVFSDLHDAPGAEPLAIVIYQATSAIAILPAAWLVWLAFRIAPPGRGPLWRTAATHAVGAVAMSGFHVVLFTLLRQAAFALMGRSYGFGPIANFPYEFRKDLIGYVVAIGIFWTLTRLSQPHSAPAASPASFDIREGGRVIRAEIDQILAVTSAGNYVEFVLADGRRPLMRTALARMEAELSPHGFVRTHRSWLVNAGRVSELRPEASGDYRVLVGGIEAPVSRRFREALARLKAGSQSLARST